MAKSSKEKNQMMDKKNNKMVDKKANKMNDKAQSQSNLNDEYNNCKDCK